MSASEGAHIAAITVTTLQALRSDDQFSTFWDLVLKAKQELGVQDPELPRKRKKCHIDLMMVHQETFQQTA